MGRIWGKRVTWNRKFMSVHDHTSYKNKRKKCNSTIWFIFTVSRILRVVYSVVIDDIQVWIWKYLQRENHRTPLCKTSVFLMRKKNRPTVGAGADR